MDTKISGNAKIVENFDVPKGGSLPTQIIQHTRGWSTLGIGEIWEFRELVYFMVVREIQGVYRQTALGISWIFIRPILNSLLLTLVFGGIVKISTNGVPYLLFSLSAQIPWGYFSNATLRASRSLVDNLQVISKIYFPRMTLPLAASISGLVDMGASLVVFFATFLLYRMTLRWEMLMLPVFVLITMLFSLATGLWLATLSVRFRDVSFAVSFLLQALMYLSPVIYPIELVPKPLQWIYLLNPMTGVIQGFRWALLGSEATPGIQFVYSVGIIIIYLISGAYIFRRTERTIVDIL
jgi:lipopolysaccharide transport system permease protein